MRKFLIAIGCLALLLGSCWLYIADRRGHWTNRWSTIDMLDEADAPAIALSARAVSFMCRLVAPGYWSTVVIVKKGQSPSEKDEVLLGEIPRGEIKLTWRAPDRLEILVSSTSIVFEQRQSTPA
jgi:hypothetical protein